jgi:cytochrome c oxidase cbb3-type subunit 1
VRVIGGAIFLSGMLLMAYNVYMTTRRQLDESLTVPDSAAVAA